jgi:hypothetical protein
VGKFEGRAARSLSVATCVVLDFVSQSQWRLPVGNGETRLFVHALSLALGQH